MNTNFLTKFFRDAGVASRDERGAESSEVILVLVLLVIGLMGAWAYLKGKIGGAASSTGDCIQNANSVSSC